MRLYKYKATIIVPDTENQGNYKVKGLVQCVEDDTYVAEMLILKWLANKEDVSEWNVVGLKIEQIPIITQ